MASRTIGARIVRYVDENVKYEGSKSNSPQRLERQGAPKWIAAAIAFAGFVALLQDAPAVVTWLSANRRPPP
jgi:hypothetical protein